MNKKIFTLIAGALLFLGSAFTASAQTPTVHYKVAGDFSKAYFVDTLRADTIDQLQYAGGEPTNFYVLGITGIANPSASVQAALGDLVGATKPSTELSYVLTIDNKGFLIMDTLAKLVDPGYNFKYPKTNAGTVNRFAALRKASWCVSLNAGPISGSNGIFDFTNLSDSVPLQAPLKSLDPTKWGTNGNYYKYLDTINLKRNDPETIVNGWSFSRIYAQGQSLQKGRALWSQVDGADSVVVFVLEEIDNMGTNIAPYTTPSGGEGGWKITVKQVHLADLSVSYDGSVIQPNGIPNVLLFTLKTIQPFVLNMDDYNAIADEISFEPDAIATSASPLDGWNPFTPAPSGAKPGVYRPGPNSRGPLRAQEVSDSLYRYGYMYFQNKSGISGFDGKWLQVDTSFWNTGTSNYLAFKFDALRDTTDSARTKFKNTIKWGQSGKYSSRYYAIYGDSSGKRPDSIEYLLAPALAIFSNAYDSVEITAGTLDSIFQSSQTNKAYWRLDSLIYDFAKSLVSKGWNMNSGDDTTLLVDGLIEPNFARATKGSVGNDNVVIYGWGDLFDSVLYNNILAEAVAYGVNTTGIPTSTQIDNYLSVHAGDTVDGASFWDLLGWISGRLTTTPNHGYYNGGSPLLGSDDWDSTNTVFRSSAFIDGTWNPHRIVTDYAALSAAIDAFHKDSLEYLWAFHKDSLMENQAKFRVVYDPYGDSAWINVYQSRMPHPDMSSNVAVYPPYWVNSFEPDSFKIPAVTYGYVPSAAIGIPGTRPVPTATPPSGHSYHSWNYYWYDSNIDSIDKVVISTADTIVFYAGNQPLAHIYGKAGEQLTVAGNKYHVSDSLLYVDIHNISNAAHKIASLNEFKDTIKTHISLGLGSACDTIAKKPVIPNADTVGMTAGLYLIRNSNGNYLQVPLWSTVDSVYWWPVDYENGEDPTQMPSYQWIVTPIKGTSKFTITNREFEKVSFPYSYFFKDKDTLHIAGLSANSKVLKEMGVVYRKDVKATKGYDAGAFATANKEAKAEKFSFIPLIGDAAFDNTLGYKYVDPDAAYTNVYSIKYLHFLTMDNPRYLRWNGYTTSDSSGIVYVDFSSNLQTDGRLYFSLEEMNLTTNDIASGDLIELNSSRDYSKGTYKSYANFYKKYNTGNIYKNSTLKVEKYGAYVDDSISVPLVRQAYRLLLKDRFKTFAVGSGDDYYMAVGKDD